MIPRSHRALIVSCAASLCCCRCIRLASARVEEVVAQLKQALQQHEVDRVTARVRRHRPALPGGAAARHVAVLQADDEAADQMERIMQGGCRGAGGAAGGAVPHVRLLTCCCPVALACCCASVVCTMAVIARSSMEALLCSMVLCSVCDRCCPCSHGEVQCPAVLLGTGMAAGSPLAVATMTS